MHIHIHLVNGGAFFLDAAAIDKMIAVSDQVFVYLKDGSVVAAACLQFAPDPDSPTEASPKE